MKRFLRLALYADLVGCVIYQLIYTLTTTNFYGLAVGIFSFFNFIFPTLGAVIIYLLLRKKMTLSTPAGTAAFQAIVLSIIYCAGLFVCMLVEVSMSSYGIEKSFEQEYWEFMVVAIGQAITIPLTDMMLARRKALRDEKYRKIFGDR